MKKIVFQSQTPKWTIFTYLICTPQKFIPTICLHTANMYALWSVYSIPMAYNEKTNSSEKSRPCRRAACAATCCCPTPPSDSAPQPPNCKGTEDGTEGNLPRRDCRRPAAFRGSLYRGFQARGEKRQPWNVCLFSFLLFLNVYFLHRPVSWPETRKGKPLHRVQAGTQHPASNSPASSRGHTDWRCLSYECTGCYSSMFRLFSPNFRLNACINKFYLFYSTSSTNGAK